MIFNLKLRFTSWQTL